MKTVKLTEPGSFHVLTVAVVTIDSGGNWPDYHLSDSDVSVVLPKSAADRQLERMKIATAFDLVGSTVKVSRSEKPGANGKHFWNLDLVNAREAQPAPSKRVQPPRDKAQPFDQPTRAEREGNQTSRDEAEPWDESPYGNGGTEDDGGIQGPPPLNAREQLAAQKALTVEEEYLALWSRVAERQASVGKALNMPVDGSSVQAATFSIWGLSGRGR